MWNTKASIWLSRICTWIFMAILVAGLFMAQKVAGAYIYYNHKPDELWQVLYTAYYICCVPAVVLLWNLHRLLECISRGEVFTTQNVKALRIISWCCMAAALICLIYSWLYPPFLFVVAAAAFMALILRVLKNVFEQAVTLKQENDFTI